MASCEPISAEELQSLLSQQERSQQRWTELGSTFWLKLVISTRKEILTKCPQYQSASFDFVYIDLLKMLVGKSYGKIQKYFSDISLLLKCGMNFNDVTGFIDSKVEKQQKFFTEILKGLFGNTDIMEIFFTFPWWLIQCFELHRKMCGIISKSLNSEDREIEFEIPNTWQDKKIQPLPFEIFLRSRWADELFTLLSCEKKQITWWSAKPATVAGPPKKGDTGYNLFENCCNPYTFSNWLAPYVNPFFQGTYQGRENSQNFFDHLKKDEAKILTWDLLALSFPPMWSRKFYKGPSALTNNFTDSKSLPSCLWISTWFNSFGLDFLVVLQEAQQEFLAEGAAHKEDGLSWKNRMTEYTKTLQMVRSLPNSLTPGDLEKSATFLVEPFLVLQLPWYPSLLQLWLAAALMEIIRFDAASMEFRHWPVDEDSMSYLEELLFSICECKERLLYGLALLSCEINSFPKVDPTYPDIMLDRVILPVLPMLDFLLKGHGYKLLRECKLVVWGDHTGPLPNQSIPLQLYTIHPELAKFYYNHFFHPRYWMDDKLGVPYPKQEFNFDLLFCELKMKWSGRATDFHLRQLSDEETLIETGLKNFTPTGDPAKLVEGICLDVLCEEPTPEAVEAAKPHALLAIKIAEFTSGVLKAEDNDPSLLHCLVKVTAEALVREQEVRVAAVCAKVMENPMILNYQPQNPNFPDVINELFANMFLDAQNGLRATNRKWLEARFLSVCDLLDTSQDSLMRSQSLFSPSNLYHAVFDHHCRNIMYHAIQLSSRFESTTRRKIRVDPYSFYCLPLFILLEEEKLSEQTSLEAKQCHGIARYYLQVTLLYNYSMLRREIEPTKNVQREAVSMDQVDEDSVSAHLTTVKLCLEDNLAPYDTIASLCVPDHTKKLENCKNALLVGTLCFPDKILHHKLEFVLWKGWRDTLTNQWFAQKFQCSSCMFPEAGTPLEHLCRKVRDILTVYCHLILVCGELLPEKKQILSYRIIKEMQPAMLKQSRELYRFVLFNETVQSEYLTHIEDRTIATQNEITKKFKTDTQDLFIKFCVALFDIRNHLENMLFNTAERILTEISTLPDFAYVIYKANFFEEVIQRELKLRVPTSDSSQAQTTMAQLANSFLNMSLDVPPPRETRAACAEAKPLVEICDICKKQASPGQNFVMFESKFYCSSQCKGSVQKQWCRFCKKREQPGQKFLQCAACQADPSYPDPNYFCSEECYSNTWWEKEHKEEHLEFELGLGKWYVPG